MVDMRAVLERRAKGALLPWAREVEMKWPNVLGEQPEDALGKHIMIDLGHGPREHSVEACDGNKLILRAFL
jgi:hypothetical protein